MAGKTLLLFLVISLVSCAAVGDMKEARRWHDLGIEHSKAGRDGEAVESFEKAVELTPNNVGYLKDLAEAYATTSRYQDSIDALTRALELRPGDTELRYSLGMVYLKKGDRALAMEEYKVLRRTDPELAAKLWERILK
ncbi:MAG: tetratricopeptide repeat protein [Nitrospirota bacterium]|jgi:tetratricopeptide (TPR) repeat protein